MNNVDNTALFKIGYGLYVVTSKYEGRHNGLIVNTVTQVTNTPNRVSVAIDKSNFSHDIIKSEGKMNVNCLSVEAPFSVFKNFGFQSGRDVDKFAESTPELSENGLAILRECSNAFISLEVENYIDLETHGLFICKVTEAKNLSDKETMTYTFYQKNVKPKPEPKKKTGYVCKVCGYVYEEESLPENFVCPWCKHGAEAFEKMA